MYERILVPVDGTDAAMRAAREALALARSQRARLRFIHVLAGRARPRSKTRRSETCRATAPGAGKTPLDRVASLARRAGVAAEADWLEWDRRDVSDTILAEANRWAADLIVIGTHGRHGLKRALFGSVAEGVIRRASVPVLLIRRVSQGKTVG